MGWGVTRTRSIKASDGEWELWARACDGRSFNGWAREILSAAAEAWVAADARQRDAVRQRDLLREAMGRPFPETSSRPVTVRR